MRIHITNGDSAGALIQRVVGDEPVLPWRDVLHEGPVPADLELPALSAVRAAFIVGRGWGDWDAIHRRFRDRDAALMKLGDFKSVHLWFEHDLYDQLQLLQVLDGIGRIKGVEERTSLVQADRYLGALSIGEVATMRAAERPVTSAQLELATNAWAAFRSPTPERLADLLALAPRELPFLAPALERLLAELPQPRRGLARTEALILETLAETRCTIGGLYAAVQAREPAIFMGDMAFFHWLERLGLGGCPLVRGLPPTGLRPPLSAEVRATELELTPTGRAVLAGKADWVELHKLRRWLGGTHLHAGHVWRWEAASRALTPDHGPAAEPPGEAAAARLGSPA